MWASKIELVKNSKVFKVNYLSVFEVTVIIINLSYFCYYKIYIFLKINYLKHVVNLVVCIIKNNNYCSSYILKKYQFSLYLSNEFSSKIGTRNWLINVY